MSELFSHCKFLSCLTDISNWNTQNDTNISFMFFNCKSLSSSPDISKGNTENVIFMKGIFSNCKLLTLKFDNGINESFSSLSNYDDGVNEVFVDKNIEEKLNIKIIKDGYIKKKNSIFL